MAFQEDPPAGVPEWLVTFGDMMSLLLTFFIMLVSMSELKSENRVAMAVEAMKKQFGRDKDPAPGAQRRRGPKVQAPVGENAMVRHVRPGDQTLIGGSVLFEEASDELTDDGRDRLRPLLPTLLGRPQKIEIRGHASKRASSTEETADNAFDLAYARAKTVMDFVIAEGIPAKRIRLSVAGANEPAQLIGDKSTKVMNSRVEVFLVNEIAEQFEGSDEERKTRLAPAKL